jgi:hypothetical protein
MQASFITVQDILELSTRRPGKLGIRIDVRTVPVIQAAVDEKYSNQTSRLYFAYPGPNGISKRR